MNFLYKWRKLIFIVAIAAAVIVVAPQIKGITLEEFLNNSPENLFAAAGIILLIYLAKPFIFVIPSIGVFAAVGIIFPLGWALFINFAGFAMELSLGWLIGRWMGKEKIEALVKKSAKAEKLLGRFDGKAESVIFMTRLIPMPYPIGFGSMFFGASGVGFVRHLIFSMAGFSATLIPVTIAGSSLEYPITADFFIPLGISIAVVFSLFVIYKKFFESKIKS